MSSSEQPRFDMAGSGKRLSDPTIPAARAGWRRWLSGIVLIAALAGAVTRFGDLALFARLLRQAQPLWLIAAIALQATTYACVASGWRLVLARAGSPRPLRPLMRIAVTKLFADQAMPSAGIGGNILLVDQLVALGVARGAAVATLLVSMIGYYAAYALLALVMLGFLWMHQQATALISGIVTSFLLVALAIPALALWLRRRGSRPLPARFERIGVIRNLLVAMAEAPAALLADRLLLMRVAALNGAVFLADAATLYACLHALGIAAGFATAFIALMMASIVVTLGPVPLGLGSFEATSTAMLRVLGVPVVAGFAATMLLRLLTLWLPLLPGLIAMRRALRRKRR